MAMLVRMLILAPIFPVRIALAIVVLGVIPRLGRLSPTAMFAVFITVQIDIVLLAALVLPSDQLFDQALNLARLVVAGSQIEACDALGALITLIPARAVPAFVDKTVCRVGLRLW